MHLRVRALLFLFCISLGAQVPSGEIRLTVTDTSGAVSPASGRLAGPSAFGSRTFDTDPQGHDTFSSIPFGHYRLDVSRAGFAPQSIALDVSSAAPVVRTIQLAPRAQATSIDVVATTPLPGTDLSLDQIPSPVQTAGAKDLNDSNALDLSDFINKRLNGVYVNDNSENPFQPDINYRGYTASSLLGTPEGLSVYMDGVRQNQPFGDIVAWDLIPKIAIDEMTLMPGSDPLYGLNTLGGALSVQTKDGLSHPGTSIQATGGMFGQRAVEAEHGGSAKNGLNWYLGVAHQ